MFALFIIHHNKNINEYWKVQVNKIGARIESSATKVWHTVYHKHTLVTIVRTGDKENIYAAKYRETHKTCPPIKLCDRITRKL